jgi:hypothetical protein
VLLCLVAAGATAAEVEDWSDAPGEWIVGLDISAFCKPGAWTFESVGAFVSIGVGTPAPPGRMDSESAFFMGEYRGPVSWSPEGPVRDELTTFGIRRGAGRELAMEGYVGNALAASRRFEIGKIFGWIQTRKRDAPCEGGQAALIEVYNGRGGIYTGKTAVTRANLALAGDGALIVRFDNYTCRLCFSKDRQRIYARFPAAPIGEPGSVCRADEPDQPPGPYR